MFQSLRPQLAAWTLLSFILIAPNAALAASANLSFTAQPSTVAAGESTTLRWSSDTWFCAASGDWSGWRWGDGSYQTGPLDASATFTLQCRTWGGSDTESVTVTVTEPDTSTPDPTPAPSVAFSAAATSLPFGGGTRLSWNTENADSCSASGGWSGSKSADGSQNVGPLESDTRFNLTCQGPGGSTTRRVDVAVAEPATTPAPTLSLQSSSNSVASGGSTRLTWSSANATACSASGAWSGSRAVSGSQTVGPIGADARYSLTCSGAGGSITRNVDVAVTAEPEPAPEPTVSLESNNDTVASGGTVRLSWTSTNANTCAASGGWSGSRSTSGTANVGPLDRRTTFNLNCSGDGGSALAMLSVAVNGSIAMSWQAPTRNTDGTPITDLANYRIYLGGASRDYDDMVEVAAEGGNSYDLSLPSGSYYIAMTAVDEQGNESAYSNEVVRAVD